MTEVKFHAEDWYERYRARQDFDQIKEQFSALNGLRWVSVVPDDDDRGVRVVRRMRLDTNISTKIDNKDRNLKVHIVLDYVLDYEIEKNLSSEDAEEAERALKTAIMSDEDVFRVRTVMHGRNDKEPVIDLDHVQISDFDSGESLDNEKATELIRELMANGDADLGDYSFIRDLVPMKKDERIEMICRVPEELMISNNQAEQEFQVEDWMNYYNAKLDEADLNDSIDSYYEGHPTAVIDVSGDTITTEVESGLALYMGMFFEDAETGEEIETDAYVVADFTYTVVYKVDNDLDDYIEDIEESLNEAIKSGSSTFAITVPAEVVEVRDVDVTCVEQCQFDDDELAERIAGGESAIIREIKSNIEQDLSEATDARHNGDCIQPPADKDVKFICTIPAE